MAKFFANPYGPAVGFYFTSAEELEAKTATWHDKHGAPVEEWSLDFIDGDAGEPELFAAAQIDQSNLNVWFEEIEDLDGSERAALFFLLSSLGYKLRDALEKLEDCSLSQCDLKEAASANFDERFLEAIPDGARAYIDYDAWARDQDLNGEMHEFDFAGQTWTCTNADAL